MKENVLPCLTQTKTYPTATRQLYLAKDGSDKSRLIYKKKRMAYFFTLQCYFEKKKNARKPMIVVFESSRDTVGCQHCRSRNEKYKENIYRVHQSDDQV